MGRTIKDQKRRPTARNVWEIVRRQDGSFDIFSNDELAHQAIPGEWLEDQLTRYGICGEEYRDARRELDQSGRVKLIYRAGRKELKTGITNDKERIGTHS